MAVLERLVPNGDNGGWTGGGTFADIDNGVDTENDSVHLDSGGSGSTDETVILDFVPSGVVDADIVTGVVLRVRAKADVIQKYSLTVSYLGSSIGIGGFDLTTSFENYFFILPAWNVDRTAAQMDAIQFELTGGQSGMPDPHTHEISEVEALVIYEPATPVFGDMVKQNLAVETAGTSITADLGRNPTSGNLLICLLTDFNELQTITSRPSGFTAIHGGAGTDFHDWCFKISDGTEQTATYTFGGTIGTAHLLYVEVDWDGSVPTITKNEDESNISSTTLAQGTGSITPVSTNNVVGVFYAGNSSSFSQDHSLSPDYDPVTWWESDTGAPGVQFVIRVNAPTVSTSCTRDHFFIADEMYGSICCFDVPAAAGGAGILVPRMQTKKMRHMLGR